MMLLMLMMLLSDYTFGRIQMGTQGQAKSKFYVMSLATNAPPSETETTVLYSSHPIAEHADAGVQNIEHAHAEVQPYTRDNAGRRADLELEWVQRHHGCEYAGHRADFGLDWVHWHHGCKYAGHRAELVHVIDLGIIKSSDIMLTVIKLIFTNEQSKDITSK